MQNRTRGQAGKKPVRSTPIMGEKKERIKAAITKRDGEKTCFERPGGDCLSPIAESTASALKGAEGGVGGVSLKGKGG